MYSRIKNGLYTLVILALIYIVGNAASRAISNFIVIPGNIIGMGIMFTLLRLHIVSLEKIEQTAEFFLKHLSLFFVPFGVSVMKYYSLIRADLINIISIIAISSIAAMFVSIVTVNHLTKES